MVRRLREIGSTETDPLVLESYSRDHTSFSLVRPGRPAAMFTPRSTAEVAAVVQLAAENSIRIVIRGAGSGLSGGCTAVDDCLVLNMAAMTNIVTLDARSLTATVQPGVINSDLKKAAAEHDLWYAPDPGSTDFSSIGGNVATNAGGMCCIKYGVTRDALLGLEVVLPDGTVERFGRGTRKGVMGYDLVSLFCGSEGTLGVITEVTVRLIPKPAPPATVVGEFTSLVAAGAAIEATVRTECPSMLELLDRFTIDAIEKFQPLGFGADSNVVLIAQSDLGSTAGNEQADRIAELFRQNGSEFVAQSSDPAEASMLLQGRRIAYTALEAEGETILDDVAVPIGAIAQFLDRVPHIAREFGVRIATFGHAGDGNMHPTIITSRGDAAAAIRAGAAFDAVVELALSLGGTATGEHGVGLVKSKFLERELGSSMAWHRRIRGLFDPCGLLLPSHP